MAEALAEAGAIGMACMTHLSQLFLPSPSLVYCLDWLEEPDEEFRAAQKRANPDFGGSLHYKRINVRDTKKLDRVIAEIAAKYRRLDGLIAAARIWQVRVSTVPSDFTLERPVSGALSPVNPLSQLDEKKPDPGFP